MFKKLSVIGQRKVIYSTTVGRTVCLCHSLKKWFVVYSAGLTLSTPSVGEPAILNPNNPFFQIWINAMRLQDLFRNLSGKNLCGQDKLVFIDFDVMTINFWQEGFLFFSENGINPFLNWRKITFLTVTFMFWAHISAPLLILIKFCLISTFS